MAELVKTMERKLSIFSESATGPNDRDVRGSWKQICQIEAEELRGESFGVELLHAIGFVYSSKAKHFLATQSSLFGVGGWLHGVQGRYHVFSETSVVFVYDPADGHYANPLPQCWYRSCGVRSQGGI